MDHIFMFKLLYSAEKIITAESHFIQRFCRKMLDQIACFGIIEFGWAGSLYDWVVFQVTKIGRACIESKFQPYKLI